MSFFYEPLNTTRECYYSTFFPFVKIFLAGY